MQSVKAIVHSIAANRARGSIWFKTPYVTHRIRPLIRMIVHAIDMSFADFVLKVFISCGARDIDTINPAM